MTREKTGAWLIPVALCCLVSAVVLPGRSEAEVAECITRSVEYEGSSALETQCFNVMTSNEELEESFNSASMSIQEDMMNPITKIVYMLGFSIGNTSDGKKLYYGFTDQQAARELSAFSSKFKELMSSIYRPSPIRTESLPSPFED